MSVNRLLATTENVATFGLVTNALVTVDGSAIIVTVIYAMFQFCNIYDIILEKN